MPDFDTRRPQESDEPGRLRAWSNASGQRIPLIAERLRALLSAGKRRILLAARRFRALLVANRFRTLFVGGGLLLCVVAISVGLLISASGGADHQEQAEAGSSSGQGGESETGAVFVGSGRPVEGVKLDDIGNGNLVFQKGSGEIWAMSVRGSDPARITEERKTYPAASLSPDGEKIAFASGSAEGGSARIYVTNADGSGLTRLTDTPEDETPPIWSPGGERIAFLGAPDGVNVIEADASGQMKLPWSGSTLPSTAHVLSRRWAWAPQGRTFAYTSGCRLYIAPADASGTLREFRIYRPDQRVASASPEQICPESPAYSPDGRQIVFTNEVYEGGDELYVMDVFREGDAHTLQKLTDDFVTSASWSPDGSEIAFVRSDSSSTQIYKIDVNSLEETRLAEGIWPTWSPDGEKLAFVGEGGSIYLMDADGSNPTPIFDAAWVQVSELVWQP
jgi:Tol biopolymer transport system component